MLLRIMVLLVLLLPVSLFGEYLEGDNGDWVWVGSAKEGEYDSKKDDSPNLLNVTNIPFTYLSLNIEENSRLFNKNYWAEYYNVNLFHISLKRKLYYFSLSYNYSLNLNDLYDIIFETEFATSGLEASFIYGVPLSYKARRNSLFLLSMDIGGLISFYSSRDPDLKMDNLLFMEPRFGIRLTRSWCGGYLLLHSLFSAYVHVALQYKNFKGIIVDSSSATPDISLYDINYYEVKPMLVFGAKIQLIMFHLNLEFSLINTSNPSVIFGFGIAW